MTDLEIVLATSLIASVVIGLYASMRRSGSLVMGKSEVSTDGKKEREKQRVLAERARIVRAIEAERGSKVITMIHRKEPWADPLDEEYITIEDTEQILGTIHETPKDKPIDMILHTPGGLALAAEMISTALYDHPGRVSVFVPFYAMSGGTLCALAADEIYMEKFSVLGPVDPQLDEFPASGYEIVLQTKKPDTIADQTIMMAHIAELAVKNMKFLVTQLLSDKMSKEQVEKSAEFLTGGYITHDTPLSIDSAKSLGLNVKEGVPEKVFELFTTIGFAVTHRPSRSRPFRPFRTR